MRGKAQPDGRPAVELIETPVPVLLLSSCGPKYTCITASWNLHWRHLYVCSQAYWLL